MFSTLFVTLSLRDRLIRDTRPTRDLPSPRSFEATRLTSCSRRPALASTPITML